MEGFKNYGLQVLIGIESELLKAKALKSKGYDKNQHEEIRTAIHFLKRDFMINRLVIDVDCGEEELKGIVDSQFISMKGKTWSVLHEEVVALQINGGKGRLTITEVEVKDEEENTLKSV